MIYCWRCTTCDTHVEIERPIAECNVPPTEACGCDPEIQSALGPNWQRVFQAPMIMNAALPDGTRRKGFALEKEAAKLDVKAASAKPKEAAELRGEAKKLRSINAKGS